MLYKTQGIVIRRSNLNETDRLLVVYTKELGKILVKARSVRKNESKLRGHIELFCHSHFMIAPGRGIDILAGAETIDSFLNLRQDLSALAAAYYFGEVLDKLVVGPEKDERVWQMLVSCLSRLDQRESAAGLTKEFGKDLVGFLGYGSAEGSQHDLIRSLTGQEIKSEVFLRKVAAWI